MHVSGLPPYIVPIAFPESIIVRTGDVSVVSGPFDLIDLGHRVNALGGQVLAVFTADESRTGGPSSPLA
ncbi:hypothetical protein [Solirubrobacter deserti]|uniref:Uncharacterized protein n=1 Tax=Solirubrobacter deserti TaxID=2282478 RepID=A0ABT4RQK2_9ACTN|nr:hypothetical protein [Solirubrobacter deserti]MDA0140844.1 hypothetical protein [Solirubrobacter deserti]